MRGEPLGEERSALAARASTAVPGAQQDPFEVARELERAYGERMHVPAGLGALAESGDPIESELPDITRSDLGDDHETVVRRFVEEVEALQLKFYLHQEA